MHVVEAFWDLSSTAPSVVAQGFLIFSYTFFFLSLSYTNTCEHTCLCVHRAYSLHVNGNPGNLLSPSNNTLKITHQYCGGGPHLSHLSPCSFIPSPRVLCVSSEAIQSMQLQPQLLFRFLSSFILIMTLFSAEILLLVSSPSAIRRTIY